MKSLNSKEKKPVNDFYIILNGVGDR